MRSTISVAFLLAVATIGCGPKADPVVGTYGLQQEPPGFGEGAEKAELALRDDKTFEITLGIKLAEGTWSVNEGKVTLSKTSPMGTTYAIDGNALRPVIDGKEVTFWRWVKK